MKGREQGGKRAKEGVSPTNHLEVTPLTRVCLQLRGYFSCSWALIQSKDTNHTTTTLSYFRLVGLCMTKLYYSTLG